MIVVLFNGRPFVGGMVGPEKSCMSGLAALVPANFPEFLVGALLAKCMDRGGAALFIAHQFLSPVGTSGPCRALTFLFVVARGIRPEPTCRRPMTLSYPRNTPSPPPDERQAKRDDSCRASANDL